MYTKKKLETKQIGKYTLTLHKMKNTDLKDNRFCLLINDIESFNFPEMEQKNCLNYIIEQMNKLNKFENGVEAFIDNFIEKKVKECFKKMLKSNCTAEDFICKINKPIAKIENLLLQYSKSQDPNKDIDFVEQILNL